MKKNIIYSFIMMFVVVLFTACGSDNKENPPKPDSPYNFFNATTPLKIKKLDVDKNGTIINDGYTVAVQLLKDGLVESAEIIQMLPFNLEYGFVTDMVVTTGTNGYAVFTYYPPENYATVIGQDITIQAVFLDPEATVSGNVAPEILLTQDFVLQFR